ncbi:SDR family NAD(P)-dependent oxidoreductase [Sandaracinobacteroides saxicola]|uniref:SDR family oxidoreductase n=1 Tax=Sandaracinobacteroides saxicola TaxID=2759707 RepID=A0A7G5IEY1_9SPHN|nr:SDR family oxidoreductase [Sandaracinobacteroides saxicola]QMW21923.1 SDR family oxidoreductase [Sandaracinobacteroides saxicola]
MSGLAGKIALVNGAASGIGAATVALLRERGASVLGTDLNAGGDILRHDVTSEADWDAAIAAVVARFGRLDILVSNAGTADSGAIVDLTLERIRAQSRVHVEGAFIGIQRAVAQMRRQASPATGSIVTVASIAGVKPIMQTTVYGTAKAALINMTRAIGVDLGRKGDLIRVNAVCPGGTRTGMTEALFGGAAYWDDPKHFESIPLKDYCRPGDIAEAIAYLAGDEAEFVTASHLVVDGGWVLSDRI